MQPGEHTRPEPKDCFNQGVQNTKNTTNSQDTPPPPMQDTGTPRVEASFEQSFQTAPQGKRDVRPPPCTSVKEYVKMPRLTAVFSVPHLTVNPNLLHHLSSVRGSNHTLAAKKGLTCSFSRF